MNTETQREWTWIYRQLVHEAGHNLLFGIAREEPLVGDDASERHASPVRADARPMDGVFHAAFVSAREALSFDAILSRHEDAGHLSHAEARTFEGFLQSSVLAFWDCVETLRGRAQLTGLGAAVLGDCEDYMRDAFAVEPA